MTSINTARRTWGFWCVYLVGHLVGPHGHLLHRHVRHVAAVRFGGCPRDAELDILWPARGERTGQRSGPQHDGIPRSGGFYERCQWFNM